MYLTDYGNKMIDITYYTSGGKGRMIISVMSFLNEQGIGKIKKLINLILHSESPEQVDIIADYCNECLKQYEQQQKRLANLHVDARDAISSLEAEIKMNTRCRDKFKRKSEQYEHFNELVKNGKEALKKKKVIASSSLQEFKRNERTKEKFLQVLEFINR